MLSNFFGAREKKEYRILLLGWPGKSSFLYWNKLNTKIVTIPTIGFNVESLKKGGKDYVLWEFGGCSKIKPLVKHYYEGSDAIIYFLGTSEEYILKNSLNDLQEFEDKFELPKIPIVFFFVDRDLENNALNYKRVLELSMPVISKFNDRPYIIQFGESFGSDGRQATGHKEIFIWLETVLKNKCISKKSVQKSIKINMIESNNEKFEWMSIGSYEIYSSLSDNYSDEEIIEKIENYQLDIWDHKTHLRLAYIIIITEGRRDGVLKIMEMIENYIKNSKNTNGKTFHLTMTYFWIHMVHLGIVLNSDINFSQLLEKCPWLMNRGLYKYFYSDEVMLKDENSRKVFTLPDKNPFPNYIPN
jgi:hypothetical protein